MEVGTVELAPGTKLVVTPRTVDVLGNEGDDNEVDVTDGDVKEVLVTASTGTVEVVEVVEVVPADVVVAVAFGATFFFLADGFGTGLRTTRTGAALAEITRTAEFGAGTLT